MSRRFTAAQAAWPAALLAHCLALPARASASPVPAAPSSTAAGGGAEDATTGACAARPEHALGAGFGAEVLAGLMLLDDPRGRAHKRLALGGSAFFEAGRLVAAPPSAWRRALLLQLDVLVTERTDGTAAVNVNTRYTQLGLAAVAGYPFSPPLQTDPDAASPSRRRTRSERLLLYAKAGPVLTWEDSTWRVGPDEHAYSGTALGLSYGAGVRATLPGLLGMTARLEAARVHRRHHRDWVFGLALGASL